MMLQRHVLRIANRGTHLVPATVYRNARALSAKTAVDANGLRVLFCGADQFSIHSLLAVNSLRKEKPDTISSIDVVCRPDKRVGRGRKILREVPIKKVAQQLELPMHQIDTFTGWTPPEKIDLVVAVSFGLLVPPRILDGSTHGGLNVHPSLLPQFRGPAPIHHTLLQGKTHTGVSVQTMHPEQFDRGLILAQTPAPGVEIPSQASVPDLVEMLGRQGADMLRMVIERRLFEQVASETANEDAITPTHAPKITPRDHQIDWDTWTSAQIHTYDRVLGRLWDFTTFAHCCPTKPDFAKRVTFHGPWHVAPLSAGAAKERLMPGRPVPWAASAQSDTRLAIPTVDGQCLVPRAITIESERAEQGVSRLLRMLLSHARAQHL